MKVFTWLWIGFLLLCFFLDGSAYFALRGRLTPILETGLDAALVAGVNEEDLAWGKNLLDREKGIQAGMESIKKNLGEKLKDKGRISVDLFQVGEQIQAKGSIEVKVPLFLLKAIGQEGKLQVNKIMNYQGKYK